jgi:hypothetical protein
MPAQAGISGESRTPELHVIPSLTRDPAAFATRKKKKKKKKRDPGSGPG